MHRAIIINDEPVFRIHYRYNSVFEQLNGADVHKLIMSLFAYVEDGTIPDFSDNDTLKILFSVMQWDIDYDWESENSEAGE